MFVLCKQYFQRDASVRCLTFGYGNIDRRQFAREIIFLMCLSSFVFYTTTVYIYNYIYHTIGYTRVYARVVIILCTKFSRRTVRFTRWYAIREYFTADKTDDIHVVINSNALHIRSRMCRRRARVEKK